MGAFRRGVAIALAGVVFLSKPLGCKAQGVPEEIREIAGTVGSRYGICPELLEAIAYEESRFTADVVSENGKYVGLMQVNPSIHAERMERLGVADLKDPEGAMMVAADYLSELFEEYEDAGSVLMAYGGSGARIGRYEETGELPSYVERVLDRSSNYEREHGK